MNDKIIETRQKAIHAAAIAAAGHPDNEVAFDADGNSIGASTVDIGKRVLELAAQFELWITRAGAQVKAQGRTSGPEAAESVDVQHVPVSDEGFDLNKCPIHFQANESQYNKEYNPLYCKQCEWERKDFINEDEDTGEMKRETKWRLEKGKGSWKFRGAYFAELRSRGLIE